MDFNWFVRFLIALTAKGTPIINSLNDLYAQIRFLRMSGGLSISSTFNRNITRLLRNGDPKGATNLQNLMSTMCLRRRKDMEIGGKRILELPGIKEYLHKIGILCTDQWLIIY